MRKARPERIRVALRDDPGGSTPLELPARRMWPAGILFAVMFAIFGGILWIQIVRLLHGQGLRSVFDLMFMLFEFAWILGWSVGVVILGLLTVLFLAHGESARLANGRLILVPRLGPLKFITEYDLARMRNLRLEHAGSSETVRIRFDYGGGSCGLGGAMPRADAEELIATIRGAAPASISMPAEPAPAMEETAPAARAVPANLPAPQPFSLTSPAALALIAANLVPLAGVLLGGWSLAAVVVLFWAESAVIGFYTVLKMAVVGKWAALFAGPFFAGHFGGFMAIHFLFIYAMFVRGFDAKGPEPGALDALAGLFVPLAPALAALFISHGISFAVNFMGRREYAGETVSGLMSAPYRRIIVMQLTIIFGGWILMALKTPAPALALLIVLKIAADLRGHRREHGVKGEG